MSSNTLRSITFEIAMAGTTPAKLLVSMVVPMLVLVSVLGHATLANAAPTALSSDTVSGKIARSVPPSADAGTPVPPSAVPQTPSERASLLKGKLSFRLPAGFAGTPLPPGARMGNADVKGTVYAHQAHKQLVIAAEWRTPSGVRVKDDDHVFLERARADYIAQMQKSLPDYEIIGDKALRIKGLGIRQTEGISTFGQARTLSTSLLAASGTTQAVVRIISRADDGRSHEALVAEVLQALRATR